ncbi:MAG: glutathione peroxidase [Pseudomonadota bacterium]|nr:glutathione peroxidase [Pseudomonadota bacterium]
MRTLLILLLFASSQTMACSALLSHEFRPLAGKTPDSLCRRFEGQVVLIVNTASKCGFTPQYEGLEALHAKYKERGFSVVGFPSNDFLGQEPGSEDEIKKFCTLTYGVKFPMLEKTSVKGDNAHPMFKQLAAATGQEPGWNFHKYLVGRDGKVVKSFGSRTKPDDADLTAEIERLIAQK